MKNSNAKAVPSSVLSSEKNNVQWYNTYISSTILKIHGGYKIMIYYILMVKVL